MGRILFAFLLYFSVSFAAYGQSSTDAETDAENKFNNAASDFSNMSANGQLPVPQTQTDIEQYFGNPDALNGCSGNQDCEDMFNSHQSAQDPLFEDAQNLIDQFALTENPMDILGDAIEGAMVCVQGTDAETRTSTEYFEYRCNSGTQVSETETVCNMVLVHEVREGFVYECDVYEDENGNIVVSTECEILSGDASCVLTDSSCAVQGGDVNETVSCRVGPNTVSGDVGCDEKLVHELQINFTYECEFIWDEASMTFVPDAQCQDHIDDENCTQGDQSCSNSQPAETIDHSCAIGEVLTLEDGECEAAVQVTADEDYGYDVARVWNAETGLHEGEGHHDTLIAAGCSITDEECTIDAPVIEETLSCEIGFYIDETSETCLIDRVVEIDEDYGYGATRTWDVAQNLHVGDGPWDILDNECTTLSSECITPTPPRYDLYSCERGYKLTPTDMSCEVPRDIVVDADYKYSGLRSWDTASNSFVQDATLIQANADEECHISRSETCITASPGVFEELICEAGYEIHYTNETVSRDLIVFTDEDYLYEGIESWNGSDFDKSATLVSLETEENSFCTFNGKSCTSPSGGVTSTHSCQIGYKINYQDHNCHTPLAIALDSDYLYQADRDFNRPDGPWIDTSQLAALRSTNSCEFQSEQCITESPGVFSAYSCNLGNTQSFTNHTASRERVVDVDEDYIYELARPWVAAQSAHVGNLSWGTLNNDSTCEITGTVCSQASIPPFNTYTCQSGYQDNTAIDSCERELIIEVDEDYTYTVNRSWNTATTSWTGTGDWNAVRGSSGSNASCVKQSETCNTDSPGVFTDHSCQQGYRIDDATRTCNYQLGFETETDYTYTGYSNWNGSSFVKDTTLVKIGQQASSKSCSLDSTTNQLPVSNAARTSHYQCMYGNIDYSSSTTCEPVLDLSWYWKKYWVRWADMNDYEAGELDSDCEFWYETNIEEGIDEGYWICEEGYDDFGSFAHDYHKRTAQTTWNYSDCTAQINSGEALISEVCIEGPSTKTIQAQTQTLSKYESCWKKRRTYGTTYSEFVNTCTPPSGFTRGADTNFTTTLGSSNSVKYRNYSKLESYANVPNVTDKYTCMSGYWKNASGVKQYHSCSPPSGATVSYTDCIYTEGGVCRLTAYSYNVPNGGPTGGYSRRKEVWTCDLPVTGSGVAAPVLDKSFKKWVWWESAGCSAPVSNFSEGCTLTSAGYVGPNTTKTVDGFSVTRQFDYEQVFACGNRVDINTCSTLLAVNDKDVESTMFGDLDYRPEDLWSKDYVKVAALEIDKDLGLDLMSTAPELEYRKSGIGSHSPPILQYADVGDFTYQGQTCINYEGSTCTLWEKDYSREETDGSGGCHVQSEVWKCEESVSGAGTATMSHDIVSEALEPIGAACNSMLNTHDSCTYVNEPWDTSTGETRIINGLSVTRNAWARNRRYSCTDRVTTETCSPPADAVIHNTTCGWADSGGICRLANKEYRIYLPDPKGGCEVYTDTFRCENQSYGTPTSVAHDIISVTYPETSTTADLRSRCERTNYRWTDLETRVVNGLSHYAYWGLEEDFECEILEEVNTCSSFAKDDYISGGLTDLGTGWVTAPSGPRVGDSPLHQVVGSATEPYVKLNLGYDLRGYMSGDDFYKIETGDQLSLSIDVKLQTPTTSGNTDRFLVGFIKHDANKVYKGVLWQWKYANDQYQTYTRSLTVPATRDYEYVRPVIYFNYAASNASYWLDSEYHYKNIDMQINQGKDLVPQSKTCLETNRDLSCGVYRYNFQQVEDDPSGGCLKMREEYLCEDQVAAAGAPIGVPTEQEGQSWDLSACSAYEESSDAINCTLEEDTCIEGAETRLIGGVSIHQECWKRARVYECGTQVDVNTCSPVETATLEEESCIWTDRQGVCQLHARVYHNEEHDPSGGCHEYTHNYRCEEELGLQGSLSSSFEDYGFLQHWKPIGTADTDLSAIAETEIQTINGAEVMDVTTADRRIYITSSESVEVVVGDYATISVDVELTHSEVGPKQLLLGFAKFDQQGIYQGQLWKWVYPTENKSTYTYGRVIDDPTIAFLRPNIELNWTPETSAPGSVYRLSNLKFDKWDGETRPSISDTIIHVTHEKWDEEPFNDMQDAADPSYDRCLSQGTICTEGPETRNINGFDVTQSCWTRDFTYECEAKVTIDTCNVAANYSQESRNCLWTDRTGICRLYEYDYAVEVDDPSGGCHVYATDFICEDQLAGSHSIIDTVLSIESDTFDTAACDADIASYVAGVDDGSCALISETCIEGAETRVIDGLSITKACWKNERDYDCSNREVFDTCEIPSGAAADGVVCLWSDVNGICRLYQENYKSLLPDPSGGCTVYNDNFRCEENNASYGTSNETFLEVENTYWDSDSCVIDEANRNCATSSFSETCTEGQETRTIDGLDVSYSCWQNSRTYQCTKRVDVNTCAPFAKTDFISEGTPALGNRNHAHNPSVSPNSAVNDNGIRNAGTGGVALGIDTYEARRYYVSSNQDYRVSEGDTVTLSVRSRVFEPSNVSHAFLLGFGTFDDQGNYRGVQWGWKTPTTITYEDMVYQHTVPVGADYSRVRPIMVFNWHESADLQRHYVRELSFTRTNDNLPIQADATHANGECLATNEYGQCTLYDRTYTWTVDDGSGGCHRYESVAWCDDIQASAGAPSDFSYSYGEVSNDMSVCNTFANDNECLEVSRTCVDSSPASRVPPLLVDNNGAEILFVGNGPSEILSQPCWNYEINYSCERRTPIDECAVHAGDDLCELINTTCVETDRDGACARNTNEYRCAVEGTGGCVEQSTEFTCVGVAQSSDAQVGGSSGGYAPTNITAQVVGYHWEREQCSVTPGDESCELISTTCTDTGIGSAELPRLAQDEYHQGYIEHADLVVEECFEREKVYSCNVTSALSACNDNVDECTLGETSCLFDNADGTCALSENNYSCIADSCQASTSTCDPRKDNPDFVGHKYSCNTSTQHSGQYGNSYSYSSCHGLEGCSLHLITDNYQYDWEDSNGSGDWEEWATYNYYCPNQISDNRPTYLGYVDDEGGDATHSSCTVLANDNSCSLVSEICLTGFVSAEGEYSSGDVEEDCNGLRRRVYDCGSGTDSGTCSGQCTEWNNEYTCDVAPDGVTPIDETEADVIGRIDEGTCADFNDNESCNLLEETCTEGPETRLVEGIPVTAECWAWERRYVCEEELGFESDCAPDDNCSYSHDECLGEAEDGTCLTAEHVYTCSNTEEYVVTPAVAGTCEDDEGSIDDDDRTETGYSDAVAGLMALEEGGQDFSEDKVSMFEGEELKCGKTVFGVKNCCKFSGPLLILGCNSDEQKLQVARNDNKCISIGSYCSKKAFLGACLKKKETYCCYTSEIGKLVAEAGADQINKDFGSPKSPDCSGFTVSQFQNLDLSQVDFSSVAASILEDMEISDPDALKDRLTERINDMTGGGG